MPRLDNDKHEEFALLLSRGVKQADAYIKAGYAPNKGAASRLAQAVRIADRVQELRTEASAKRELAIAAVENEDWQSLSDMGLTTEWVAQKYKEVFEAALGAGSYTAANASIAGIQKLIEQEQNKKNDKPDSGENKIDMKDLFSVLDKFTDVVKAAQSNPVLQNLPGDDAKDITGEDT